MMHILLVNDDGIKAEGIRALAAVARDFGRITVVAPSRQRSAASHSITIERPLSYERISFDTDIPGYAVHGTPVDCVKMAMNVFLNHKPDLVLSGINWGANVGASVIYSGTVAGAMEGVFHRIPAIAFSLHSIGKEDYSFAQKVAREILGTYHQGMLEDQVILNVNIPNITEEHCRGYRLTHQAHSSWQEEYEHRKNHLTGKSEYFLTGELINNDETKGGDVYALENGYVSITPITPDFTSHAALSRLSAHWQRGSV